MKRMHLAKTIRKFETFYHVFVKHKKRTHINYLLFFYLHSSPKVPYITFLLQIMYFLHFFVVVVNF